MHAQIKHKLESKNSSWCLQYKKVSSESLIKKNKFFNLK